MQGSKSKKSSDISDEDYFQKHEQINEVKYNLFMIMYNRCKTKEEYAAVLNPQNEFKLRRLTIQECKIIEQLIILGEKKYSFISRNSFKSKRYTISYEFHSGKDIISIEITDNIISKLTINNKAENIIQEDNFIKENNISLPKIEKGLKDIAAHPKSDKGNKKKKKEILNKHKSDIQLQKIIKKFHHVIRMIH